MVLKHFSVAFAGSDATYLILLMVDAVLFIMKVIIIIIVVSV